MIEKRRYHRFSVQLPCSFKSPNSVSSIATATTLDISALGLCFTSKEELKMGQALPLEITLPDNERIMIYVEVVWVKESDVLTYSEYTTGVKILEPMRGDEPKFIKFYAAKLLTMLKSQP